MMVGGGLAWIHPEAAGKLDHLAEAVIDFPVHIEQGAHGSVDYRRFDADVAAAVFAGHANEETRNLVGAEDRIRRSGFAPAPIGHSDRVLAKQSSQAENVPAGNGFAEGAEERA